MLPAALYSTGTAMAQMTGFGLGPILGGFTGGIAYEIWGRSRPTRGPRCWRSPPRSSAWFALSTPVLKDPSPAEPVTRAPEGPLP